MGTPVSPMATSPDTDSAISITGPSDSMEFRPSVTDSNRTSQVSTPLTEQESIIPETMSDLRANPEKPSEDSTVDATRHPSQIQKAFDLRQESRTVKTSQQTIVTMSGGKTVRETTVSQTQHSPITSEHLVTKQSRFKRPEQSSTFFEQTFSGNAGLEFGQVGEENGKPIILTTVVQPVLVTTEYEINRMSPKQTFDAFEFTGPSGVSGFYTTSMQSQTSSHSTTFMETTTTTSGKIISSRVTSDDRSVELPEFIGTLGSDKQSSQMSVHVRSEGTKPNWEDTTWSENVVKSTKQPAIASAAPSDIHVLDIKTIGPTATTTTKTITSKVESFHGSFQDESKPEVSLQLKQDQDWEPITAASGSVQLSQPGDAAGRKKGRLEKEYSVASDADDVSDEQKLSIRQMKEYSVVSESEDKNEKEWNKRITNAAVVVSLEKNEQVSAIKDEPSFASKGEPMQEVTPKAPSVPEEPTEEPKTYTRKKKKDKKTQGDKEKVVEGDKGKDIDTSLVAETQITANISVKDEQPPKSEAEKPEE